MGQFLGLSAPPWSEQSLLGTPIMLKKLRSARMSVEVVGVDENSATSGKPL